MNRNPYNWQGHNPQHSLTRHQMTYAEAALLKGLGVCALAGRGMGKSVFLRMLEQTLAEKSGVKVFRIAAPPPELTVHGLLGLLAFKLGLPTHNHMINSQSLVDAYFEKHPDTDMVVLLFDEFDRYAANPTPPDQHPGRAFFNDLETARKELDGRLGILAAGSIGAFVLRDILGSSFLSRADWLYFDALDMDEIVQLAEPFREDNRPLDSEVLKMLLLSSGGHPALATYGLQLLWDIESPEPIHVTGVFSAFRVEHAEFVKDVVRSISHDDFLDAPKRVLEFIQQADGPISRAKLAECHGPSGGQTLRISVEDILSMLQAAGLIRIVGSVISDDPLQIQLIPSILNLPVHLHSEAEQEERILLDLIGLLSRMHRMAVDFFRQSHSGKKLVPENTLSAFLALGLSMLGWRVEREAQSVAGRTDLLVQLNRTGESRQGIIEAKIWPRNDYQQIHHQVERYWSCETQVGIAIMFADSQVSSSQFEDACLGGLEILHSEQGPFPISGRWRAISDTGHEITHFLLRLPR